MHEVRIVFAVIVAAWLAAGCDEISAPDDPRQRASFVDANLSGSCTGATIPCRYRPLETCNGHGCRVQESCHPEALFFCMSLDEDACVGDPACSLSFGLGCTVRSNSSCWAEGDETVCIYDDDCEWGNACGGNAFACRLIEDRGACKTQPGCEWEWD